MGYTRDYLKHLVRQGRIAGAVKVGREWFVPLPLECSSATSMGWELESP